MAKKYYLPQVQMKSEWKYIVFSAQRKYWSELRYCANFVYFEKNSCDLCF